MKLITTIIVAGLLIMHAILSALALMQARRLKGVTRTNKWVTWSYILTTASLGIGALVTVLTIEF